MVSTNFRDFLPQLLNTRAVSMRRIDDAVRRILRVKFRAGLFRASVRERRRRAEEAAAAREPAAARVAAGRSVVLLKNAGPVLPLSATKTTALIGRWATARTTCSARGGGAATTRTPSRCSPA